MAKYVPGALPSEIPVGYAVVQQAETGYVLYTTEEMEKGKTIDLNKIDLTTEYTNE